jgi:ABC-type glutathione transport system ATPase component
MTHGAAHGFPIEADDLSIEYPAHGPSAAHVAVRGFSLRVAPGEVVGLLGDAGSGKSTLARVLSGDFLHAEPGHVHPLITGGHATVGGYELRGMSRRRANEVTFDVGYLAQDAAERLAPDRTVTEIVGEPVLARDEHYNRKALAARVATMVDAVRLPLGVLERYPYQLSGGQRQRVALARALVLGPSLLVADEPTAGIDVTVRDAVVDLFRELQQDRAFSALVISHDPSVLRRLASRIAVLHRGSLVAVGALDDVLGDPTHPYVRELARAFDSLEGIPEE